MNKERKKELAKDLEIISKHMMTLSKFKQDYEATLTYHTCNQVLENNILIWKLHDIWYIADNNRNQYHDFPYHPKTIKVCEYCKEMLQ